MNEDLEMLREEKAELLKEVSQKDRAIYELSNLMGLAHFSDTEQLAVSECREKILQRLLPERRDEVNAAIVKAEARYSPVQHQGNNDRGQIIQLGRNRKMKDGEGG